MPRDFKSTHRIIIMFYSQLQYPVLMFIIIGIWPLNIKNKLLLIAYRCICGVAFFFVITLTAAIFLEFPQFYRSGIQDKVSNISYGFKFVFVIVRCWIFQLPIMRYLAQRVLLTEQNILRGKNEEIKIKFLQHVKMTHKLHIFLMLAVCFNTGLFIASPFIMKMSNPDQELSLPLESWLPFNQTQHYMTAFTWNILGGTYIVFYYLASDMAFFALMIFSISQIEILKCEISNGIDNTNFNDNEVRQNLRNIIIYYRNIRKFVADLNSIMKFLNLAEFIYCIAHMAMVGFDIATKDLSFELVKIVFYFLWITIGEVVLYYWFGNEIYLKNCEIIDAIWESDWYNCNLSNKKTILILMMEAQRPLRLEVGYSQNMSLETLIMILRTSASYMITLQRLLNK